MSMAQRIFMSAQKLKLLIYGNVRSGTTDIIDVSNIIWLRGYLIT